MVVLTASVGVIVAGLTQAVPRRLAQSSPEGYGLTFARTMDLLDTLFVGPAFVLEAPAALVSPVSGRGAMSMRPNRTS